jgi:hypothetical protein
VDTADHPFARIGRRRAYLVRQNPRSDFHGDIGESSTYIDANSHYMHLMENAIGYEFAITEYLRL